ncbi:hypothetical protein [Hyphomicrobium facile]|uniref:Uncharacterized protein n=1 Tax=Hyphomicrobium facile TaxID=51670 RepID=A0A1I7NJ79_9HYPH|nr:hypothetical protein [Hyphomicrobium facile]SFV34711.1 hypothetical protein SAMN04488557_2405 [Hyphomicrobium facile]
MKRLIRTGLIAFAATVGMASSSAYAGCVLAGGESVMVTEDLAKFMAGQALKHSIENHGWTPRGVVRIKCDTSSVGLPHCTARQKACG